MRVANGVGGPRYSSSDEDVEGISSAKVFPKGEGVEWPLDGIVVGVCLYL